MCIVSIIVTLTFHHCRIHIRETQNSEKHKILLAFITHSYIINKYIQFKDYHINANSITSMDMVIL